MYIHLDLTAPRLLEERGNSLKKFLERGNSLKLNQREERSDRTKEIHKTLEIMREMSNECKISQNNVRVTSSHSCALLPSTELSPLARLHLLPVGVLEWKRLVHVEFDGRAERCVAPEWRVTRHLRHSLHATGAHCINPGYYT